MPPVPSPVPEMTDYSDKGPSDSQQMTQPSMLLPDDDKLVTSSPPAVDLEKGLEGTTHTRGGMFLRWARITKEVEIKEGSR